MPSLKANGQRLNGSGSKWITKVRRLAIYLRDGFTCAYCGRNLHGLSPRHVTLDHLKPQSRGGSHQSSNLVTACLSCNSRRRDLPWSYYAHVRNPELASELATRIRRIRRRVPNIALAQSIIAGEARVVEVPQ